MFCRKCGTKLLDDDIFCNKCGAKVINNESVNRAGTIDNARGESKNGVPDDSLKEDHVTSTTPPRSDISGNIPHYIIESGIYLARICVYFTVYVIFTAAICFFEVPADMFKEFLTDTGGLWAVCFQYIGEAIFFETMCIPLLVWIKKLKDRICIFEFLFTIAILVHILKLAFGEHFIEGSIQLIIFICSVIFIIGMGFLLFDKRLDKLTNGRRESTLRKILYVFVPFVFVNGVLFSSFLLSVDSLEKKENTHKPVNSQSMEERHEPGKFVKLGDPKNGILVNVDDGRLLKISIVLELNPNKKEVVSVDGSLTTQAETQIIEDIHSILRTNNYNDAYKLDLLKAIIKNQLNRELGAGTVYDVYITKFELQ